MAVIMCCKECVAPKRHPGCHGTRGEYLAERAKYELLKEQHDQKKRISADIYNQRADRIERALRKHGRKLL